MTRTAAAGGDRSGRHNTGCGAAAAPGCMWLGCRQHGRIMGAFALPDSDRNGGAPHQ